MAATPPPPRATILFFQDAHQLAPVVDRYGDRGGFARLATLVARVRAEQPATLVVFGGDLAGGTLFGGQFRGTPQVEAFNRIGLDAATFGQHDFDFGAEHARALVAASRFQWTTANLVDAASGQPFTGLPRALVREAGGLRIAFLGLTDDFHTTLREGSVEARDLLDSARSALAELGAAVDATIVLAQADVPVAERLLREIPSLDAVLVEEHGEDRSTTTWIGARPIAAAAGNLGSVIRLDLRVPDTGGRAEIAVRALPVDASIPPDPALSRLTADYEARMEATLGEVVATFTEPLGADGARSGASALGSLVADAWRDACASEIAVVNSGSLRGDLPAGPVRMRDVVSVLPFGNQLVVRRVSGADLVASLEHGASGIATRRGTLLHAAGLDYRIVLDAGTQAPRLLAITVGGKPIEPERVYRVAMSNYLARGGDGFERLAASVASEPDCATGGDAAALAEYLRRTRAR